MSPPALLVIDVQKAFADPVWGRRDNPDCERNIGALIERWREQERPVVFVRHDSDEPDSTLRPDRPGSTPRTRSIVGIPPARSSPPS